MKQMIQNVQTTTNTMKRIEETKKYLLEYSQMKSSDSPFKGAEQVLSGLNPLHQPVPGPLNTSLGRANYWFSKEEGFEGPVSKDFRFADEHVQPGLEMHKLELTTIDPKA